MPFPLIYIAIASWLSIVGGIYGLFSKAEDVIIEKSKTAISNWLKNLDFTSELPNVPALFAETFDSIFTKKHFSDECILRSCVASLISVLMLFLISTMLFNLRDFFLELDVFWGAIGFISASFFFNFIPDYLSLLETRTLIKLARKTHSATIIIILLLVDLLLTFIIFTINYFIISTISDKPFDPIIFSDILRAIQFDHYLSIFLYSTFFTSVWLWLYAISGFIIKLISSTRKGLRFFQRHLDIDNKPLRSMAFVLITLITLTYFIIALFLLF